MFKKSAFFVVLANFVLFWIAELVAGSSKDSTESRTRLGNQGTVSFVTNSAITIVIDSRSIQSNLLRLNASISSGMSHAEDPTTKRILTASTQEISMMLHESKLWTQRGRNISIEDRTRRNLVGGIIGSIFGFGSLILSTSNAVRIGKIHSELNHRIDDDEHAIAYLNQSITTLRNRMSMEDQRIEEVLQLSEFEILMIRIRQNFDRVTKIISDSHSGRFSHEFINRNELKSALTQLALKSRRYGLVLDLSKVDLFKCETYLSTDANDHININVIIPLIESEFEIFQIQIIPEYFFQENEMFINQTLHNEFICVRNGLLQYFPTNTIELNRHCLKQKEHAFLCKHFPTHSTITGTCEGSIYYGKGAENCDFEIRKIRETMIFQDIMSQNDFHIFSKESTRFELECMGAKSPKKLVDNLRKGHSVLQLYPGCKISTTGFQFQNGLAFVDNEPTQIFMKNGFEEDVDFAKDIQNISTDLARFNRLSSQSFKAFTKLEHHERLGNFGGLAFVILSVIILAIMAALGFIVYKIYKHDVLAQQDE